MAIFDFRSAVAKRFDPTSFYGRPLSLIIIAFLMSLFLFGGLLQDIVEKEPIVLLDQQFSSAIATLRDPLLTQFFYAMTFIGEGPTAVAVIAILCIILFLYKKRSYIPGLLVSVIGSELMDSLIKVYVHRPRPTGPIPLFTEVSFSFPSGHATIAVALYGFLIYVLYRICATRMQRTVGGNSARRIRDRGNRREPYLPGRAFRERCDRRLPLGLPLAPDCDRHHRMA